MNLVSLNFSIIFLLNILPLKLAVSIAPSTKCVWCIHIKREREYVVFEGSGVWQGRLLWGPVSHPLTELVKDKAPVWIRDLLAPDLPDNPPAHSPTTLPYQPTITFPACQPLMCYNNINKSTVLDQSLPLKYELLYLHEISIDKVGMHFIKNYL